MIDHWVPSFLWIVHCLFLGSLFPQQSRAQQDEDFHFHLVARLNDGVVASNPKILTDGTRVSVYSGDLDFVLTGLYGIENPRIAIDVDADSFYYVETEKHNGLDVLQKAVEELGLQLINEIHPMPGYSIRPLSPALEDSTNWPDDLFSGRVINSRLKDGRLDEIHYSYEIANSSDGQIYLKDGVFYFENVSCAGLERFLEQKLRRVFKFEKKLRERFTFKISTQEIRTLGSKFELKNYFELTQKDVKVPTWIVRTKQMGGRSQAKRKVPGAENEADTVKTKSKQPDKTKGSGCAGVKPD